MSWFAPKVLKSEYDKVVAENMELKMMLDELTKPEAKKKDVEFEDTFEKHEVKRKWNPTFSPEDLAVSVIEKLDTSDEVKRINGKFYLKSNKEKIAEESEQGLLKVSSRFIRDVYNDLSDGEFPIKRLPSGTIIHLYNHGLVKVRTYGSDGYFQYHWTFENDELAYIFTPRSIELYNKQKGGINQWKLKNMKL